MVEIIIATFAFLVLGALIGVIWYVMQKSKTEDVEPELLTADAENADLRAVILCSGTIDENPARYDYKGVKDCLSAAVIGDGGRTCTDGCIGYGSCAVVCPEEAITVRKGIAAVHPGKCTGCGLCVGVCPKNLIVLEPRTSANGRRCIRNCPGGICGACTSGGDGK
ncbi:MAG: 4Fe-4S binding protein [Clostridia bacterium]|nr:4Fe-4S binding protein [Clostridia bacterium]